MQPFIFPELEKNPPTASGVVAEDNLLADLNKAQRQAVTTMNGPLLVIAGAGSGKTRTLVYRVAHLIGQGVPPENILLLTFTRKSSQEMLARASLLLDDSCRRVTGGTFHAVANMLLRRHGHHLGYPASFTILDRSDAEGIINILKSSLAMGGAGKRFPTRRAIINVISKSVNKSRPLDDLFLEEYGHLEEFLDDILLLRKHYEEFKFEHGLMDYDDLLVNLRRVLAEFPVVRQEIAGRFSHIMVDEYQDTNPIQAAIVRLLAHGHDNVMAVGDDSQSIYSFRGADFRNIMQFPDIFPDTRIITLEENYRSTQPILNLANEVISKAEQKYTKVLHTRIEGGEKPLVFEARNGSEEARFICEEIETLRSKGVALSEIAVLFRSGFHSYKLELELASRQIPFEKRGGLKLTESAHVKDMLSFFRILLNPRDNLSWNRILLFMEKLGPKTAQKILEVLQRSEDLASVTLRAYAAASPKLAKQLNPLADLIDDLTRPGSSPLEQFEFIFEYYKPIFERIYHDDYPRRRGDLDQLKVLLEGYVDLESFVADTALDPPEMMSEVATMSGGEQLVLSTVHSAKGLEWDTVFVINLAEGQFPNIRALPGDELEEERRLLYVAVTRAKQRLFCTYPREVMTPDRKILWTKLSPLLGDIKPGFFNSVNRQIVTAAPYGRATPVPVTGHLIGSRKTGSISVNKGDLVRHPFFGEGRVERVFGARSVDVLFNRHGRKTLHLDYAKLELVE